MRERPRNPSRVGKGIAERATGEALGDDQFVSADSSNQMRGKLTQIGHGVEDAIEN
jgi:hypothetical protein